MTQLEQHFQHQHDNPPPPFNPDFESQSYARLCEAARSMEADGFYATHSRIECAAEIRKRCADLKAKAELH